MQDKQIQEDFLQVSTDYFNKHYKFVEDYDDLVACIDTKNIYAVIFKGFTVELFLVSNDEALRKLEIGMLQIRKEIEASLC